MEPVRAVLVLLLLVEAAGFAFAGLVHLGISVFGVSEARGPVEAVVQAIIGLLMLLTAYTAVRGTSSTRPLALATHTIALVGYAFGFAASISSGMPPTEFAIYNELRAGLLVLVLMLLLLPISRRAFRPRSANHGGGA